MARQSLQRQGVPIPDHLQHQRTTVRERTPIDGQMGGTRDVTRTYSSPSTPRATRQTASVSRTTRPNRGVRNTAVGPGSINPVSVADKSTSGVGLLEGEFLLALLLLFMLMLANKDDDYSSKIMSLMKRGTLVCLLFFLLALVASIGGNATKFAKAFGALIIVAILITTPVQGLIGDVDNLIKNDWVGTNETANDETSASSDASTSTSQSSNPLSPSSILNDAISAVSPEQQLEHIIPGASYIAKALGWLHLP